MRADRRIQNNRILLCGVSVYAAFLVFVSSTDAAMLRTIVIPKTFCDLSMKCDNYSLCVNHLNVTTGCYENLCVVQETVSNVTCDTLNCHPGFECTPCAAENPSCRELNVQCTLENHQNCSSVQCANDYSCQFQKSQPGKSSQCYEKLAKHTHLCKKNI